MDPNNTKPTKKPKTAKQMEAFRRANDTKNEKLRKWREENLRREARGEEPLIWAKKAKARKDAVKVKEKEEKLHQLFLKSLEIQRKQLEDDEEKARIEKQKTKVKPNTTRRNKPIRKEEYSDIEEDYYYTDSDEESESESEDEEEPLRSTEQPKMVKDEKVANVDDIREQFQKAEQEAQFVKYLLEQQKQLEKQKLQQPAPQPAQQPQLQPAPQPQSFIRPIPQPQPQTPVRQQPAQQPTQPPQLPPKQQPQQRTQYATREDFNDLKTEIINKIQNKQIELNGDKFNIITDTKVKKPIEPPKYTTDINYVYNPQTLREPVEEQKPLNTVKSAINPVIEPSPPPQQYTRPNLSEESLRSMMGMRQRYEVNQPQTIQYTTNSPILNRVFFNHKNS